MLDKAKNQAQKVKADIKYVCYEPGSFDMPLVIEELLKKKDVDVAVTLARGNQGEHVMMTLSQKWSLRLIADLSLKHGKPCTWNYWSKYDYGTSKR